MRTTGLVDTACNKWACVCGFTGDFSEEGLTDDMTGMTSPQVAELLQWVNFYESHAEYRKVRVVCWVHVFALHALMTMLGRLARWAWLRGGSMTTWACRLLPCTRHNGNSNVPSSTKSSNANSPSDFPAATAGGPSQTVGRCGVQSAAAESSGDGWAGPVR